MKKLTSLILGISLAASALIPVASAADKITVAAEGETVINPANYAEGSGWNNHDTYIAVENNKTTAEEYVITIPFEVAADGDYQMKFVSAEKFDNAALSPVKFSLDDGDKVRFEDGYVTKLADTSTKLWGVTFTEKKYTQSLSLTKGEHTISFTVDEMRLFRGSPKGYYAAVSNITISPKEPDGIKIKAGEENVIKPYEHLDGSRWTNGGTFAKVESGSAVEQEFVLELLLYVPESDMFTMKFEAALNPSASNYHMSAMKLKIDDGEIVTISGSNSTDLGASGKKSWGEALKIRQWGERLNLSSGQHTITFIVDELRTVDSKKSGQYAALGDITLSPVTIIGTIGDKSDLGFGTACTYTSSNADVASVSESGEVTLARSGKSTVKITDADGNTYNAVIYVTRETGYYVDKAYISGKKAYVSVKGGDGTAYTIFAGKRKASTDGTLYGFDEIAEVSGDYAEFSDIASDEEIVIFLLDENGCHLYGKTVLTLE